MMAGQTLAQQIALLDNAAPADVDIEHLNSGLLADEETVEDLSAGRAHYIDVGVSLLRKQRDAHVDPKYDGARTSRSQLYEFDEGSDDERPISEASGSESSSESESADGDQDHAPDFERPHSISHPSNEDEAYITAQPTPSPPDEASRDNLAETIKKSRRADQDKGRTIIRQRAFYDSLIETRIRMQKAATATNQLPLPDRLPPYVTSQDGREAAQTLLQEVIGFSEDLFALRKRLLAANEPDIETPSKRRKVNSIDDIEQQIRASTLSAVQLDASYHPSCIRTLQKWSSKISAVNPTVSNRNKSFKGGAPRSAVELVEDALGESGATGGGKAVGRTRVKRFGRTRIGNTVHPGMDEGKGEDDSAADVEVFDDLDFYQSILRDVIDSRTGEGATEDWASKQRIKKAKKVVDTKASKGRKLRYEIHEKLQNFMVPVEDGTWHEEQIDELFANLLGRGGGSDRLALV